MKNVVWKKTIFISLLGHLTAFCFLGFSFGRQLPDLNRANIAFWGGILKPYDFRMGTAPVIGRLSPNYELRALSANPMQANIGPLAESYLKPYAVLPIENQKSIFSKNLSEGSSFSRKRGQVVMLYPELPYRFNLYFQDRTVAYIGLEYNVVPRGKARAVLIRRKISSGNLETDLLCMRYISLFLSIERDKLMPNKWQALKIELKAKK